MTSDSIWKLNASVSSKDLNLAETNRILSLVLLSPDINIADWDKEVDDWQTWFDVYDTDAAGDWWEDVSFVARPDGRTEDGDVELNYRFSENCRVDGGEVAH